MTGTAPQKVWHAALVHRAARVLIFFMVAPAALVRLDAWSAVDHSLVVTLPGLLLLKLLALFAQVWRGGKHGAS